MLRHSLSVLSVLLALSATVAAFEIEGDSDCILIEDSHDSVRPARGARSTSSIWNARCACARALTSSCPTPNARVAAPLVVRRAPCV